MIPLLDLKAQYATIKDEVKLAIDDVLEHQSFILGSKVEAFEKEVAAYCDVGHAIGVASGTDALLLALMAIDLKPSDEVITTPYTFFATAGSIARLGAKTVFVDIDPKTYNINPSLIEKAITKRTKAIIPVHLYGQCADMDPILAVAKKHNLTVIEDAAQAIGAKYKNRQAGSIGHFGCFSFFPSKNLGAFGDGGMVVSNDANLAERVRVLRVHGSKPKYYHEFVGCCSRLDALQAAVLSVKLKYLNQWTKQRCFNAKRYDSLLKGTSVIVPHVEDFNFHIFNQYIIRVKNRDQVREHLTQKKIGTEIYYPLPLHLQKCFKGLGYKAGDFPESEKAANETLGLPIYAELTDAQQKEVVAAIKEVVD